MKYSEEEKEKLFSAVIDDIVLNNLSLRKALIGKIDRSTFYKWCDNNEEYAQRYARAYKTRSDVLFDEIIEIADESSPENHQVDRLKIDARKWALSKMQPKKYGDKLDVTSGGEKIRDKVADLFPKDSEFEEGESEQQM